MTNSREQSHMVEPESSLDEVLRRVLATDDMRSINEILDQAVAEELADLNITSPSPQERKPRYQSERHELEEKVRKSFENQLRKSAKNLNKQGLIVPFFEYVRERCSTLYDRTLAYSTVTLFACAAEDCIEAYSDGVAPVDAGLLKSIKLLLKVLLDDIAGFQGINMVNSRTVIEASDRAICHLDELSRHLAELPSSSEEHRKLACGWREELQCGIGIIAEKLPKFYKGIGEATRALEQYENLISRLNADEGQPVLRPDSTEVSRHIARAHEELQGCIDELLMYSILDVYASELIPWRELLTTLKKELKELEEGRPLFQITTVKLRYCFPFAVDPDDEHLPDEIGPRITPSQLKDLKDRLNKQLQILMPCNFPLDVESLHLTEFWQGAGTGMYSGLQVKLPQLAYTDPDTDSERTDRWDEVWIELSQLRNHCLCIQRTLKNPTPTDLYRALRAPGYCTRGKQFQYVLDTGPKSTRGEGWRSIDDFARDLTESTAIALCDKNPQTNKHSSASPKHPRDCVPDYVMGQCHIVAVLRTPAPLGDQPNEIASALRLRHGGRLLRVDANRTAATLAEWVRYPLLDENISLMASVGLGFRGDWMARLGAATVFGVVGAPSWHTDAYIEAVQFAASWYPRLLIWDRKLTANLKEGRQSSYLRKIERDVRSRMADMHSEDLCRLGRYRHYLDELMISLGTIRAEQQLEKRLTPIKLLISEEEEVRRSRLLAILGVFAVFSISTFFTTLEGEGTHEPFKNPHVTMVELLILSGLFLSVLVIIFWILGFKPHPARRK